MSFPQAGTYRVQLEVVKGGYTLTEPYDLVVITDPPPAGVAPYVVTQPVGADGGPGRHRELHASMPREASRCSTSGGSTGRRSAVRRPVRSSRSTASAAGSAGDLRLRDHNAYGTVTSATATLTVNGVGGFTGAACGATCSPGSAGARWRSDRLGQLSELPGRQRGDHQCRVADQLRRQLWPALERLDHAAGDGTTGSTSPPMMTPSCGFRPTTRGPTGCLRAVENGYRASATGPAAPATRVSRRRFPWSRAALLRRVAAQGGRRRGQCRIYLGLALARVWVTPADGSVPLPGAVLEYQVGGTLDDNVTPPADYPPIARRPDGADLWRGSHGDHSDG